VKLYEAPLSPFAARVRIQLYAKGLEIPRAEPPGGPGSDEYRRINPIGKTPALVLDDGSVVPESNIIGEYLEDRFPEPSLRPAEPFARARMRLLCQFVNLYAEPPLHALFPFVTDPSTRDPETIAARLEELSNRYDQLTGLLAPEGPLAVGPALTLADCTMFPLFFFATRVPRLLGGADPTAARPRLAAWWKAVQQHPAVAKVDAELTQALAKRLGAS
jgi:glutathione S-transferase